MHSLNTIVSLFALGAIVGIYLLTLVLQKKETPKIASLIHGLFVASALTLLIIYSRQNVAGLIESIILFSIAALMGLVLIIRDLSGKPLPAWFAIGHGLVAVTGFIFLLTRVFT